MGLFDFGGKEKKARAEALVSEKLARHPAVDIVLENIIEPQEEHQWLNTVCGYYDARVRTVIVGKDILGIHNCPPSELRNPNSQHEAIKVVFTDLGYTPLPGYRDPEGNLEVDQSRVAELLAEVVKTRISAVCPTYTFGNVISETDDAGRFEVAYFTYKLPALTWKEWF